MKKIIATAALTLGALSAQAAGFDVYAYANSSSGGSGLATIALTAGQSFTVSASTSDLWSAGALPRWSNADGLVGNTFATGSDESGQVVGTQIGANFGLWNQNSLSAAYGTLVGELNGQYFALGTNYSGTAASSGTLNLYYWDSNYADNRGSVHVDVSAVPEPGSYAMMGAGLLMLAALRRRQSRK